MIINTQLFHSVGYFYIFFQGIYSFFQHFTKIFVEYYERGNHQYLRKREGGERMKPIRTEWQVRCAFNSFCIRVLKNEVINAYKQRKKQQLQETTFSNLTLLEKNQLYTLDNYNEGENTQAFQIAGREITSKLLEDALLTLPDNKRIIVLLYYFFNLSDVEIGQLLQIPRSTVQYRRTSSFKLLKQFLEVHTNEYDD